MTIRLFVFLVMLIPTVVQAKDSLSDLVRCASICRSLMASSEVAWMQLGGPRGDTILVFTEKNIYSLPWNEFPNVYIDLPRDQKTIRVQSDDANGVIGISYAKMPKASSDEWYIAKSKDVLNEKNIDRLIKEIASEIKDRDLGVWDPEEINKKCGQVTNPKIKLEVSKLMKTLPGKSGNPPTINSTGAK